MGNVDIKIPLRQFLELCIVIYVGIMSTRVTFLKKKYCSFIIVKKVRFQLILYKIIYDFLFLKILLFYF